MSKVLAQAGTSLADVYNVEGSIAGVRELLPDEVHLVHEMGGTIFSERLGGQILREAAGAVVASADFAQVFTTINRGITRIHGITVLTDDASRIARCNVNVRTQAGGQPDQAIDESVVWVWDGANSISVEIVTASGAQATVAALTPSIAFNQLPTLLCGQDQPQLVSEIALRGTATAFGAGTVDITALLHVTFAQRQGLSSKGLPIPGW